MWKKILPLPKKLFEQEDESPTVREEAALAERVTSKVTSAKQELLIACEQGDLALLDASLSRLDRATALSTKDSQSWPLLAIAASRGHEIIVKRLLEYGCPVDIEDDYGSTPLYRAVGFRQNGCVKALLAAGANMLHVNKDGNNIIHNSAYVCNDYATQQALKAGVNPTQPNAVGRICLLDMVENQPHVALVYLDSKVQRLANYVQYSKMLYDFTGLDYKDAEGMMDSPLEAMVKNSASNFLLSHMLVKQYLAWQWRLYGKRCFVRQLVAHVALMVLVTYVAVASKYKLLETGASLHRYECCSEPSDGALNVLRAAAELLLVPLTAWEVWGEVQEYVKSGHTQVRVRGSGTIRNAILRVFFRTQKDIHQTRAMMVAVPRYLLDVWNVVDLGALLLIIALGVLRVVSMAMDDPVMSNNGYSTSFALLVLVVWTKLLAIAGVFRITGPKLRVLRRMLINVSEFSVLYLLFFVSVSVALFVVLGGAEDPGGYPGQVAEAHSTIANSLMSTFQITLASGDYQLYQSHPLGAAIYIGWTVLSTLLLLSLLVAMLSYDFEVGVEVAEQEWLVVFGGYLLKQQRLLGDGLVQRLKAEDLQRCHDMGGFDTPVGEAKTNLPAAPARTIPARMMIIWEDTTSWPPAFRRQMEEQFSYDDEDFDRALMGRGGDGAGGAGDKD